MQSLPTLLSRLTQALAVIAGASLAVLAILVFLDVFGRYFLNSPLPFAVELIELLVAVAVMGALPLTSAMRAHVKVDLFENAVGQGGKRLLSLFSTMLTLVFVVLISWQVVLRGADQAEQALVTPILAWPVYPVTLFATIGAIVTCLVLVALLFGRSAAPETTDDWD